MTTRHSKAYTVKVRKHRYRARMIKTDERRAARFRCSVVSGRPPSSPTVVFRSQIECTKQCEAGPTCRYGRKPPVLMFYCRACLHIHAMRCPDDIGKDAPK